MGVLSESKCYELLASGTIGRVGLMVDGTQLILPVNYTTDGRSIVICVGAAGTLALNAPMAQVAFEVDYINEAKHEGWSVLLHGIAHDVTDAIDEVSESLRALSVSPWASGEKSCWLKITPQAVSGRMVP